MLTQQVIGQRKYSSGFTYKKVHSRVFDIGQVNACFLQVKMSWCAPVAFLA